MTMPTWKRYKDWTSVRDWDIVIIVWRKWDRQVAFDHENNLYVLQSIIDNEVVADFRKTDFVKNKLYPRTITLWKVKLF